MTLSQNGRRVLGDKTCERKDCDLCELLNELFSDFKEISGEFKLGKYGRLFNH